MGTQIGPDGRRYDTQEGNPPTQELLGDEGAVLAVDPEPSEDFAHASLAAAADAVAAMTGDIGQLPEPP